MRFEARTLGTSDIGKELRGLASAASDAVIEAALVAGAEFLVEGVKARIRRGKTTTGTLESAIGYRLDYGYLSNRGFAVNLGWEKVLRRKTGGSGKYARRVTKRGKVYYTTDYGPILEYSDKRQLRHLRQGFDDKKDEAVQAMLDVLQDAMK